MKIGLIAMSGVRVRTKELAELGVTLGNRARGDRQVEPERTPDAKGQLLHRNSFDAATAVRGALEAPAHGASRFDSRHP